MNNLYPEETFKVLILFNGMLGLILSQFPTVGVHASGTQVLLSASVCAANYRGLSPWQEHILLGAVQSD